VSAARGLRRGPGRRLAVALGAAVVVLSQSPPALADEPPEGPLAIDVHAVGADGPSLREGDERTYAISVHNESDQDFPDAAVIQLLPGGFRYDSARPAATVQADGSLTWTQPLPADGSVDLTVTVTAGSREQMEDAQLVQVVQPGSEGGDTEAGDGRDFTTTVCVQENPGRPMLGCASDGGVLIPPAERSWVVPVLVACGVAVLVVSTTVFLVRRRRRRRARGPSP
jgi:Domain of unknown function DUF11